VIRVVCAIGGDGADEAAVRQACTLAGRGGHIALVCVVTPHASAAQATEATLALERAMWQTRTARVRASVYLLRHHDPREALLRAGAAADALVRA
jgi:hypothetical protein